MVGTTDIVTLGAYMAKNKHKTQHRATHNTNTQNHIAIRIKMTRRIRAALQIRQKRDEKTCHARVINEVRVVNDLRGVAP